MSLMTEPQLQSAKAAMRELISMTEGRIFEQSDAIKKLYPLCNPEDASSAPVFQVLNTFQTDRRFLKKKLKTLVMIQKQIKTDLVLYSQIKKLKRVKFTKVDVDATKTA